MSFISQTGCVLTPDRKECCCCMGCGGALRLCVDGGGGVGYPTNQHIKHVDGFHHGVSKYSEYQQ